MKWLVLASIFASLVLIGGSFATYKYLSYKPPLTLDPTSQPSPTINHEPTNQLTSPSSHILKRSKHVGQTFNNCGPATLSMLLSMYDISKSQAELGNILRPYQHPKGDNDDKTVTTAEFANLLPTFGLSSKRRVNGTIDLIKLFIANDIPVVVKTLLQRDDDIAHYRLVRGYDDTKQILIIDDSYHGPNRKVAYSDFLTDWQPFNYDYVIAYPATKEDIVKAILGPEIDEQTNYQNALARAEKEGALFNIATNSYHLGNYQKTVEIFESIQSRLPRRTLWYQIEPFLAYQKLGQYDKALALINKTLSDGNRAFSELYQIRGEIYQAQGNPETAQKEFDLALLYNKNFPRYSNP